MEQKESQAVLDFILAFAAVMLLIIGIARVWLWFHANFANRQVSYQDGRLVAGKPGTYDPSAGPEILEVLNKGLLDLGANATCLNCTYRPFDLTDEWIFKGETLERVSLPPGGAGNFSNNTNASDEDCPSQIGPFVDAWNAEIVGLRDMANTFDTTVLDMWSQLHATHCEWWYPFCTWDPDPNRDKRLTIHEESIYIRQFEYESDEANLRADRVQQDIDALTSCCGIVDPEPRQQSRLQNECIMSVVRDAATRVEGCPELVDAKKRLLDYQITGSMSDVGQLQFVVMHINWVLINAWVCDPFDPTICAYSDLVCQQSLQPDGLEPWNRNCVGGFSCSQEDFLGPRCSLDELRNKLLAEIDHINNVDIPAFNDAKNRVDGCCGAVPYCDDSGWNQTQVSNCESGQQTCIANALGDLNATMGDVGNFTQPDIDAINACRSLPTPQEVVDCMNSL